MCGAESLHLALWGREECLTIETKLEGMYNWCKEAKKELDKFANFTETSWRALNGARRTLRKAKFFWVKRKYLQELLENMAKDLNKLDEAAKNGWQRDQEYNGSEVDFAKFSIRPLSIF